MCHTINGQDSLGPSLKDLYLQQATLADGSHRLRDDTYFRQKIARSYSLELAGNRNVMPNYETALSPRDLNDLIAYLRTLTTRPPAK